MYKKNLHWPLIFIIMMSVAMVPKYLRLESSSQAGVDKISQINKMPDFKLLTFDGDETVSSNDIIERTSKGVIIHFWSTVCGSCIQEIPLFVSLTRKVREYGIESYFVSVNNSIVDLKRFFKKRNIDIGGLNLLLDDGSVMKKFKTYKIPETYLFDSEGNLIKKFIGPQDWNNIDVLKYLELDYE